MALPLIAVGLGLLAAGKVASDTSEAKKYMEWAKEDAEEGNEFLEDAKQYQRLCKETIEESAENVINAKKDGLECLLRNFIYFKDIDLNNERYNSIIESIKNDIDELELEITVDDIYNIQSNVVQITEKLDINLSNFSTKDNIVNSVAMEIFSSTAAHGILASGIGGVAAFAGAEFIMATGIGAIFLTPIVLLASSDKVEEAKEEWNKAKRFKEEARVECEEWKSKWYYFGTLKDLSEYYKDFIASSIDVSNYWLEKFKNQAKSFDNIDELISRHYETIAKNLISLAYLNKFIRYEYTGNQGSDFDSLCHWVISKAKEEGNKFRELKSQIRKIKDS